jgi:hypothetical protein
MSPTSDRETAGAAEGQAQPSGPSVRPVARTRARHGQPARGHARARAERREPSDQSEGRLAQARRRASAAADG